MPNGAIAHVNISSERFRQTDTVASGLQTNVPT